MNIGSSRVSPTRIKAHALHCSLFRFTKTYSRVNRAHYPNPYYAIVDNWMKSGVSQDRYLTEAKSIVKLMLIENSSYGGAGVMGSDIAAWCTFQRMRVTLQDQSAEKLVPAIKRIYSLV